MKAYLVTVLIVDHDEIGLEEVKRVLEHTKYTNWCISPRPVSVREFDIGDWTDEHPLNYTNTDVMQALAACQEIR